MNASPSAAPKPAETPVPVNSPRDEATFTDRVFLAIENPVLRRELLTSLRSTKSFVLQFIYLGLLSFIVWYFWPAKDIPSDASTSQALFKQFGVYQLVLLSMMSPAFSASAMTIEKERRCIDLLLTSPCKPGTILIGKFLTSVTYLVLLILSTAPVTSVILWAPGIGYSEIAGLYLLLVATALCFGMIGLTCSVYLHRSQSSLSITYMIVLPLALTLYILAIYTKFFVLESSCVASAFLVFVTFALYRFCHNRMRQPFDPVYKAAEEEDIATQTGLVLVRDRFPDNLLAPPNAGDLLPDSINPIYQKEIRNEIFSRGTLFLRLIIQISMFLSIAFLAFLFLNAEYVFVCYLVLFTMLIAPAFACNTFTQERERGTLDLLLSTLVRPYQIVLGKFLSCLRLSLFLTGLVGLTLVFYLFMSNNDDTLESRVLNLSVYLGILFVSIVFEIALAMFFSLLCGSTVRSMITTYGALLVIFLAPMAGVQLLLTFTHLPRSAFNWITLTSPFSATFSVSKGSGDFGNVAEFGRVWPYYVAFCVLASLLLMAIVFVNFERRSLRASNTK
jgi:ABC-type transport system involved in multi-copper enzyme maturation permease subunit